MVYSTGLNTGIADRDWKTTGHVFTQLWSTFHSSLLHNGIRIYSVYSLSGIILNNKSHRMQILKLCTKVWLIKWHAVFYMHTIFFTMSYEIRDKCLLFCARIWLWEVKISVAWTGLDDKRCMFYISTIL